MTPKHDVYVPQRVTLATLYKGQEELKLMVAQHLTESKEVRNKDREARMTLQKTLSDHIKKDELFAKKFWGAVASFFAVIGTAVVWLYSELKAIWLWLK